MLRAMTAGAAVFGALLCGGCGGDDKSAVEDTVNSYLSAVANGDGAKACDQLSEKMQRGVAKAGGADTCAAAIEKVTANIDADAKSKLEDAKIVNVKVDGDHATAEAEGGTSDVELSKNEDGDWLISGGFEF